MIGGGHPIPSKLIPAMRVLDYGRLSRRRQKARDPHNLMRNWVQGAGCIDHHVWRVEMPSVSRPEVKPRSHALIEHGKGSQT